MGDVLPLMPGRKRMALIAHDNCRGEMLERARFNRGTPAGHELYATGTTRGRWPASSTFNRLLSGPLGGDQDSERRSPMAASTS